MDWILYWQIVGFILIGGLTVGTVTGAILDKIAVNKMVDKQLEK